MRRPLSVPRDRSSTMATSVLIVPISFDREPALDTTDEMGGTLTYQVNGSRRSATVALTKTALAVVLAQLKDDCRALDDELLRKLLTQWACERLSALARARRPPSSIRIVLKFDRRTARDEASKLMERAGLSGRAMK